MTKSELINRLGSKYVHLHQHDLEKVVNTVFEEVISSLADGGRVELRGFGAFSVRQRQARKGRNPRTGAAVSVPAKRVPYFKCGKELKQRINSR
jgi:integration host factor subunit beta